MGDYIQTNSSRNKAQYLINNHGAIKQIIPIFLKGDFTTICVAECFFVDAALIVVDEDQFASTIEPSDKRPKTWLSMDTREVIKLNPEVGKYFDSKYSEVFTQLSFNEEVIANDINKFKERMDSMTVNNVNNEENNHTIIITD